jgi:hypothetical protein
MNAPAGLLVQVDKLGWLRTVVGKGGSAHADGR